MIDDDDDDDGTQVSLRWPTALAVSPLDNTLHILDDGLILKLTRDNYVIIVAGRSPLCSPLNASTSEQWNSGSAAIDSVLEHVENLAFAPDGDLFVVESDGDGVRRVRFIDSSGRLVHFAGTQCPCPPTTTSPDGCPCGGAGSSDPGVPSAVALTPDGVVHVADTGRACVLSAVGAELDVDRYGQMKVVDAGAREVRPHTPCSCC